ncbi:MAG: MoxR-like ATPase [Myxococcota bacterium]
MTGEPAVSGDDAIGRLRGAVNAVVRGKTEVVDLALVTLLAGGHLLLQDVPGVGKTTLASALAEAVGGRFCRVQFTSDLLPGDITGVNVLDHGSFVFRPGPLFANVVLADEINRTTPKTQSALFEAMAEGQITVDGETRQLPRPFFVVATQNPYDHHGTFQLPDSQLDRFLMRVSIGYPDRAAEREVLRQGGLARARVPAVSSEAEVVAMVEAAQQVRVPEVVEEYLLDLVAATREEASLIRGVSPRGAQALYRAIRARAYVERRDYAVPEDVRYLAGPVLAHRVLPRSGADALGAGGQRAIRSVLSRIPSPL